VVAQEYLLKFAARSDKVTVDHRSLTISKSFWLFAESVQPYYLCPLALSREDTTACAKGMVDDADKSRRTFARRESSISLENRNDRQTEAAQNSGLLQTKTGTQVSRTKRSIMGRNELRRVARKLAGQNSKIPERWRVLSGGPPRRSYGSHCLNPESYTVFAALSRSSIRPGEPIML
jgi:hypothetical protein